MRDPEKYSWADPYRDRDSPSRPVYVLVTLILMTAGVFGAIELATEIGATTPAPQCLAGPAPITSGQAR